MRMVHAVVGGVLLAAAIAFTGTAEANMLIDGSFEDVTAPINPFGLITLPGDSSDLPGWTISGAVISGITGTPGIDVVPNSYWQPSDGNFSVNLDGTPGHGGITQTVATAPGVTYQLTFDFAVNPEVGLPGEIALERIMDLTITAGDASVLQDEQYSEFAGSNTNSSMNYTGQLVLFVATDTTSTIAFTAIGLTTYTGPVIDNVILDVAPGQPTPEPATLAVLGLASGALLTRRRWR